MTITATFPDGQRSTRRTETEYTHASRRQGDTKVRFHTSAAAAKAAAGMGGSVVPTEVTRGQSRQSQSDMVRQTTVMAAGNACRKARREYGPTSPEFAAAVAAWERVSGRKMGA